jgi:hypothetical protein
LTACSATIDNAIGKYTYTGVNGQSFAFALDGVATHFTVSAPSAAGAGQAFSITVAALDANGNVANGYTGTVHFTTSDIGGSVVLPVNSTFGLGEYGVHTFTNGVKLVTAGTQTVTATDTGNSSITGTSNNITVSPAAAAGLNFGQQPSDTNAGLPINPAVTVKVLDQCGNVETADFFDRPV